MERSHVGEAAARVADGGTGTGVAPEEEQPCVAFARILAHLLLAVDGKEHLPSGKCVLAQPVQLGRRLGRIYRAVPCEADVSECRALHIARIDGEQQPTETVEGWVGHDIAD
ncbi:unknown [Eggerthella sp. CAG:298]|nr:unknown [Eggerthella sp. CAG:298]